MFIQTAVTPNPQTLKFLPGCEVASRPHEFLSSTAAAASPLAAALFELDGVRGVFFGADYISLTKTQESQWRIMKPQILTVIADYFASGAEVVPSVDSGQNAAPQSYEGEVAEIVEEICNLLEQKIRPVVAADGGDISFHAFDVDSGLVRLKMHGACSGCPASALTLKAGVENLLRHYIPEVSAVEAVPD